MPEPCKLVRLDNFQNYTGRPLLDSSLQVLYRKLDVAPAVGRHSLISSPDSKFCPIRSMSIDICLGWSREISIPLANHRLPEMAFPMSGVTKKIRHLGKRAVDPARMQNWNPTPSQWPHLQGNESVRALCGCPKLDAHERSY